MIAAKNEYLQEAANTIFELSADEQIRKQCRDREEYYQDLRNYEKAIAQKEILFQKTIAEKELLFQKAIAEKESLFQKAIAETKRLRALLNKHGIDDSE